MKICIPPPESIDYVLLRKNSGLKHKSNLRAAALLLHNAELLSTLDDTKQVYMVCKEALDCFSGELSFKVWNFIHVSEAFVGSLLSSSIGDKISSTLHTLLRPYDLTICKDDVFFTLLNGLKTSHPRFWTIFTGTELFSKEFLSSASMSFGRPNNWRFLSEDIELEMIEFLSPGNRKAIDLFEHLFNSENIEKHLFTLAHEIKHRWDDLFPNLWTCISFMEATNIRNMQCMFSLPSSIGLFADSYKHLQLDTSMNTTISGLLQAIHVLSLDIDPCTLVLKGLISRLSDSDNTFIFLVREKQRLLKDYGEDIAFKFEKTCKAIGYTEWSDKGCIIDQDIIASIPDLVWTVFVQLLLIPGDPDIVMLKSENKTVLYRILADRLPLRLLLEDIRSMLQPYRQVTFLFWSIPFDASLQEWMKLTNKVLEMYIDVDMMDLFQTVIICIEARLFLGQQLYSGLSYSDVLSSIAWLMGLTYTENLNPFALVSFTHVLPDFDVLCELDFKVKWAFFQLAEDGMQIEESRYFLNVMETFGIESSRILKWYEGSECSIPFAVLDHMYNHLCKSVSPLEVFCKNYFENTMPCLDGPLKQILRYGPLLSFFCLQEQAWVHYIQGMDITNMKQAGSGIFFALFGASFLVYVRITPLLFEVFFPENSVHKSWNPNIHVEPESSPLVLEKPIYTTAICNLYTDTSLFKHILKAGESFIGPNDFFSIYIDALLQNTIRNFELSLYRVTGSTISVEKYADKVGILFPVKHVDHSSNLTLLATTETLYAFNQKGVGLITEMLFFCQQCDVSANYDQEALERFRKLLNEASEYCSIHESAERELFQ